jgi:outer membrane protein TolC
LGKRVRRAGGILPDRGGELLAEPQQNRDRRHFHVGLLRQTLVHPLQEASLRGQIDATEEIIKIETQALDILRKQLELGQVAGGDVAAVEATLAQARATLPPLQKQLAVQRDLLTALIGRFPSQEPAEKFELTSLQLPQFMLTANAGTVSNLISQFFAIPGTAFWTAAGNVAQTVFDAGTLLHKKRAADAAFDQAAAMYRSTVITALQNVADALHAVQSDADTLKAAYAAERAAFKSLEIARRQLQLGAISFLGLLTAENTYDTALLALVQSQAARYADTAALFQALGGGWWNREDVPPAKTWDLQFIP